MIYIPPILELGIHGVLDPGVPNRERICLRPAEQVNLGNFGIILAVRNVTTGELTPLNDNFFWFGDQVVSAPSWILVFTGPGQNQTITEKGRLIHLFFWGKKGILFNIANMPVLPLVFRIGAFNGVPILPTPDQVRQLSGT